jgi:two-component system chemotaxis response regulator CheB
MRRRVLVSAAVHKPFVSQNTPSPAYPTRRTQAALAKSTFEVVAIAASAGGLGALTEVLSRLPAEFPVPIAIVQHVRRGRPSRMARLLGRRSQLAVKEAEAGERLCPRTVYVAPPDRHLLVCQDGVVLSDAEPINFARPAADPLFESVASHFGGEAIGVVLTGCGHDGAAGATEIRRAGGIVLVQTPASSANPWMPEAAIRAGAAHLVLPIASIAAALTTLVMVPGAAPALRLSDGCRL